MGLPGDVDLTFAARRQQYDHVDLRIATLRTQGQHRFLRGAIRFARGKVEAAQHLDYGPLVLDKRPMAPDDGIKFIKDFANREEKARLWDFQIDDLAWEYPTWYVHGLTPSPLGSTRFSEWPAYEYVLTSRSGHASPPGGPLARPDLPLIIDVNSYVDQWIGIDSRMAGMANGMLIILPDFRARISKVRFEEQDIVVSVESNGELFAPENLVVKASLSYTGQHVETPVSEADGIYRVKASRIPSRFCFFVMDKGAPEVMDWADVWTDSANLTPQIEFAIPGWQLAHIIDGGETEEVEFKEEIGDGHNLIQSVVAFANTSGGIIIVGVTNDAKVIGTSPEADRPKIAEWIENKCDPPVQVRFETVKISDLDILLIRVPIGTNKPYQHRSNGVIYVRRGATDRPARRAELDKLYSERTPTYYGH
jgi:hypothetical protein